MKWTQYEHLLGGVSGGLASTVVCHPMDLLKIRYSANEGNPLRPQYTSYWDATRKIVRAEGARGLYQGLSPNVVGATLSWGLYFHFYHTFKRLVPYRSEWELLENFFYGFVSGSAVMCFTNPIWVTKTRLCLQYESSGPKKYKGLVDCLGKMYSEEGVRGLYRGFVPGLIGTTHGALQFMFYNRFKDMRMAEKIYDLLYEHTDDSVVNSVRKTYEECPEDSVYFALARALLGRKGDELKEAITILHTLYKNTNSQLVAEQYAIYIAVAYTRLKDYDRALAYLELVGDSHPDKLDVQVLRSHIEREMRNAAFTGMGLVAAAGVVALTGVLGIKRMLFH